MDPSSGGVQHRGAGLVRRQDINLRLAVSSVGGRSVIEPRLIQWQVLPAGLQPKGKNKTVAAQLQAHVAHCMLLLLQHIAP
jgi:hypothetical protein